MIGAWFLFVISLNFLLMGLASFWHPSSIRWSSSLWKYAISSSAFVFTQSDSVCSYATFATWLHFSFNILLVCNNFCFLELFPYSLGECHGQLFWFVLVLIISKLQHKWMHLQCHWTCHHLGPLFCESSSISLNPALVLSPLIPHFTVCFPKWLSHIYPYVFNP